MKRLQQRTIFQAFSRTSPPQVSSEISSVTLHSLSSRMKFSLPMAVFLAFIFLSSSCVFAIPLPPPNEVEEAADILMLLGEQPRHQAPQVENVARNRNPPHVREQENRREPGSRASGMPRNRRTQAPSELEQYLLRQND